MSDRWRNWPLGGGGSLVTATGSTTPRKLADRFSDIIYAVDYGAMFDDVTDDTAALTRFINALLASSNRVGVMPAGTARITAALPTINVSGIKLYGSGPSSLHDVATNTGDVTVIKYIGVAGAVTMLTVQPDVGPSSQRLEGIELQGVTFDCNGLAANGVVINSVRHCDFHISCFGYAGIGLTLGVVSQLGEGCDLQRCRIRYNGDDVDEGGIGMVLNASLVSLPAPANVSLNNFEAIDITQHDNYGIVCYGPDNNEWHSCRIYGGPGTAVYSILWVAGTSIYDRPRNERFYQLSTTHPGYAEGTEVAPYACQALEINLDYGNNTPTPRLGTGASIYHIPYELTPTPTAFSGALTLATSILRWTLTPTHAFFSVIVTITTNGTGAVAIEVPLPFTSINSTGHQCVANGYETTTGFGVRGEILQNTSTLLIVKDLDGSYPGANGYNLVIAGVCEITPV